MTTYCQYVLEHPEDEFKRALYVDYPLVEWPRLHQAAGTGECTAEKAPPCFDTLNTSLDQRN